MQALPRPGFAGYGFMRTLTAHNAGTTDASDVQVPVDLTAGNFDYAHARADGADLRFMALAADGGGALPYYSESWSPGGSSRIWVRLPTVPASGTTGFEMRYGDATVTTSASDFPATFPNAFVANQRGVNGALAVSGATFSAADGVFSASDVGEQIVVTNSGLGNDGTYLIVSWTDAHTVVLSPAPVGDEGGLIWELRLTARTANSYDWFQIDPGITVEVEPGSVLNLRARRILIAGTLNGTGRGHPAPALAFAGSGPGAGGTSPTGDSGAGGAGYGGAGGIGGSDVGDSPGAAGGTSGTDTGTDIEMGSSGGSSDNTPGGAGGAGLDLRAQQLDMTGTIVVDGSPGTLPGGSRGGGGGAGGGILLAAYDLVVTGSLSAVGGHGSDGTTTANDGGGGGGGGRIKLFHESSTSGSPTTTSSGGTPGSNGSVPGGAGADGVVHAGAETTLVDEVLVSIGGEVSVPSRLAIIVEPAGAVAGGVLGTQPSIELRDDADTIVATDDSTQVTATIEPGSGAVGAVLGGTTTRTAVAGRVDFTDLSIDLPGNGYRLVFDAAGLSRATSATVDVGAPTTTTATSTTSTSTPATTTTATLGTTTTTTTLAPRAPAQLSSAKLLVLKDDAAAPARRKMKLVAKDAVLTLGHGRNSVDDPVENGAQLRVVGIGTAALYSLPAAHWKYLGKPGAPRGYRLRASGPFRSIVVKAGKLVLKGQGEELAHSLALDPRPVRIEFVLGAQPSCFEFGGTVAFTPGRSYVARRAPTASACPDP